MNRNRFAMSAWGSAIHEPAHLRVRRLCAWMIAASLSLLLLLRLPGGARGAEATTAPSPVKIIFDTDMDTDCDDVMALAELHALADRGDAQILATIADTSNQWTPLCIDAINTYYGRPDLPVGVAAHGPILNSAYNKVVAQRCPHRLKSAADAEDAVALYRRILIAQPDDSVVVATVGFHTNLAALLRSPADQNGPSGADLVKSKVHLWVCMGGNFMGKPAKDNLKLGNWNFTRDANATYFAINHWPGRLIFVGREVASIPSGLKVGANLGALPPDDPLRIAYEAYFHGTLRDRHVADPATILFAVRGLNGYWNIEDKGYIDLNPDMTFQWRYDTNRNQAYLLKRTVNGQLTDHLIEKTIEQLVLTPPKLRRAS